ncbi:MAG: helix-turn-helix transcriptional regulator [Phycisphaerae bacterium]|nr:helix-turn-helix transcriptional regulator [Phycisphaerae bacterium]
MKISQDKLASIVGISKPTVSAFEQDKLSLSLENAIKILKAIGLS